MDYASFLYDNSPKTYLKKMDTVQNLAMRIIGGFIRTTPVYVMENELNLHPLYMRRRYLAGKYWFRSKAASNKNIMNKISELTKLRERCYWLHKKIPLLVKIHSNFNNLPVYSNDRLDMFSLDTWVTNIDLSKNLTKSIINVTKPKRQIHPLQLKTMCIQYLNSTYDNFYKIYTDGSKDKTGIGAAFYDAQDKIGMKFKIKPRITIMEAELVAIAEALSFAISTNHKKIVILTDSKSGLEHVARCTSTLRGIPIAYTILKIILQSQNEGRTLVLQWLPSHIGLEGNEMADDLARQAVTDGILVDFLPHFANYTSLLKTEIFKTFSEYFDRRSKEKGIWYKTIQPHALRNTWIEQSNMDRNDTVMALRLRSGHTPCNKFAYVMKKVDNPKCDFCDSIDDMQHILLECGRNANLRARVIPDNCLCQMGYCNSILAEPTSDTARMLYKLVLNRMRTD